MKTKKESEKYQCFMKELKELCIKHKVQLETSGYDYVAVSNLDDSEINDDHFIDWTEIEK